MAVRIIKSDLLDLVHSLWAQEDARLIDSILASPKEETAPVIFLLSTPNGASNVYERLVKKEEGNGEINEARWWRQIRKPHKED